jgi:5-methylcytosine-specific restriction protein B
MDFRERREELVVGIREIADRVAGLSIIHDQEEAGRRIPMKDICPFTVMGLFNRSLTNDNRMTIARELAQLLGVTEEVPRTFEAVPILNNQNTWFFDYAYRRGKDDLDNLWELFSRALIWTESPTELARQAFVESYDRVAAQRKVGWKITLGLFWMRPWLFPTLDENSRKYLTRNCKITLGQSGPRGRVNGLEYLKLCDTLVARFHEETFPVHSFPELSLEAWSGSGNENKNAVIVPGDNQRSSKATSGADAAGEYTLQNILDDGGFFTIMELQEILKKWKLKKNLILQGPPGTGKTWLAKRLGYALVGTRSGNRLRSVQFHPNLSYEDFIRGYRPGAEGRLTLVDGPFLEIATEAQTRPEEDFVLIIEEINRGNPAQIFGEMLTLLEADKRIPEEALELSHRREPGEKVFLPPNLYVLGTMNIADRSLALVDLALRRRFAFVDLAPRLDKHWMNWMVTNFEIDEVLLSQMRDNLLELNKYIAQDPELGPQFRIGHSFVTPSAKSRLGDLRNWYRQVIETEILPLLAEYWFNDAAKVREAGESLLRGI